MKEINGGKQMKDVWTGALTKPSERIEGKHDEFNEILELIASDFELITAPSIKKEQLDKAFLKLTAEQTGLLDYISEQDNPNVVRCKKTEPIEEYLLKQLSIGIEELTEDKKQLYLKNFTHLMCQIISDLRNIDNKLKQYQQERKIIENDKSNRAEYTRRKLEYFAKINKSAQLEILDFLRDGLKKYLVATDFDTLKREEDKEKLSMMYLNHRYKYAYMEAYYDIEFDYSTCVKVNYFPNVDLYNMMQMEKKYMKMHQEEPAKYYEEVKKIVDSNNLMNAISLGVTNNFHLSKRAEIFKELVTLFDNKSYQAFVALGLLQLEGMFYDLCLLKFGEKENQGTLVEKVEKSF